MEDEVIGAVPIAIGEEAVRPAADRAAAGLRTLHSRATGSGAAILEAQILILQDPTLLDAVAGAIAAGTGAVAAVNGAVETHAAALEALADEYLRERAADIREVGRLLLAELTGAGASRLADLARPSVIVAHELGPADTLGADPGMLLALVTETGGLNSHVAIVARELGIPAVVGARGALEAARQTPFANVDGDRGQLHFTSAGDPLHSPRQKRPPVRLDDVFVAVQGNAGSLGAVKAAAELGARGIGLFRTEFLYLERQRAPTEAEQIEIYAAACRLMAPQPVLVRTLDSGSDKALPYLAGESEPNPALGCRGIRLWLRHRDLCATQVRALVTVRKEWENLWVMAPMVASREEMATVQTLFRDECHRQGAPPPNLGMMVEVPAAAMALERFMGLADFISIGTNDLAQYALAADRELELGPALTEFDPGVLRLIAAAIESALKLDIKVGVCGEMAGSLEGAVFLSGAGAQSLSMAASRIAPVAELLGRLRPAACQAAAEAALAAMDAEAALAALRSNFSD